jgi:hypothetical protein
LHAHTLKVEAAAWFKQGNFDGCGQYFSEGEHVQNKVRAILFCQDHQVFELEK